MAGSSKNNSVQPSVEEIIALLKKSSLPTVVCEGSDDLIVYRRLEDRLLHIGVSVLPAGGRLNVLKIFERRNELPKSMKIAFIADRDTWVNTGIPEDYVSPELIFTDGYSIENDVFCDGGLGSLLVGAETARFQGELEEFVEWYALALTRHLADPSAPITLHPEHVLDQKLRPQLLALKAGEVYPQGLESDLLGDYMRLLRGKSLLALLIRNTNSRAGQPKHTDRALIEMVAARPGARLMRTAEVVERVIQA